jgi:NADH dehydrogenase [ubiquinone] 1 alpha subcomplex assembly factor 7
MPPNLMEIIRTRIRAEGPMTVADYMALALTHPQYGYYVTRDPFGAAGDFTTAPEMTQAFGELIGLWCVEVWKLLGSPSAFSLTELGPGRGTLMSDALRAARLDPDFLAAAKLHLVEASPKLREKQAALLKDYSPVWIDSVAALPDLPCITLANEFFDALPVRQYLRVKEDWMERRIGLTPKDTLAFVVIPADNPPPYDMPDETVIETCPDAPELASTIARPIVKNRGAALILDYGDDEVIGETLQAVSNHRQAHMLSTPGFADITAHVSFAPLATAMRKIGCRIHGPVTQGEWLLAIGLRQRTERLCLAANEQQQRSLRAALTRLTDPKGMGSLFKAISLTDRNTPTPPGFE